MESNQSASGERLAAQSGEASGEDNDRSAEGVSEPGRCAALWADPEADQQKRAGILIRDKETMRGPETAE